MDFLSFLSIFPTLLSLRMVYWASIMRVHRLIYSISYRAPSLNMRLIFLNPHERSYAKGLVVRWISLRFFFVMPLVSNKTVEITSPLVQFTASGISFERKFRGIPWNAREKLKNYQCRYRRHDAHEKRSEERRVGKECVP